MNFQTILDPIHSAFLWTFDMLEAAGNNANYFLIGAIALLGVYWIGQLVKFQKDEVLNR